jgi:23S rRNA (adenine2503-C2)-methyltransferase
MGYDAFGLPAENHAISTGQHPRHSTDAAIAAFSEIMFNAGYSAPVRTPRGRDIAAACGQLKSESIRARRTETARPPVLAAQPAV